MRRICAIILAIGLFAAGLPLNGEPTDSFDSDHLICKSNPNKELSFWLADFKCDLKQGKIEKVIGYFNEGYHERETGANLKLLADAFQALKTDTNSMNAFLDNHELHMKGLQIDGPNAVMQIEISFEYLDAIADYPSHIDEIHLRKDKCWKVTESSSLSLLLSEFQDRFERDTLPSSLYNADVGTKRGFPSTFQTDSLLIPKYLFDYSDNQYDVLRMCALASNQIWGYQAFSAPVGVSAYLVRGFLGNHDFLFATDMNAHRVVYTDNCITDVAEKFVASYGGIGSGLDGFISPIGIDHYGTNMVLIADSRNDRIVRLQYNSTGKEIYGVDQFSGYDHPVDVATLIWEPWDNFFAVVNQGSNSIKGAWWSIGSYGSDSAKFDRPTSLAFWRSSVDG